MGDSNLKWDKHLPSVYTKLVEGVRVSGRLLDNLVQSGLLTLSERAEVDQVQPATEDKKARHMVELLRKKPSDCNSFDRFCSVLQIVGYGQLANALRSGNAAILQDGIQIPFSYCLLSVFTYPSFVLD